MHYNEVFLVRANTAKSALSAVTKWLEQFNENIVDENGEWDWWVFGGRWCWGGEELFKKYQKYISRPSPTDKTIQYYRGVLNDPGTVIGELGDGKKLNNLVGLV